MSFRLLPYEPARQAGLDSFLTNITARHHSEACFGGERWPEAALRALFKQRVYRAISVTGVRAWVAVRDREIIGLGALTPLPWDSQQIGIPAARLEYLLASGSYAQKVEIKEALLGCLNEASAQENIGHLSARLDVGDLSGLHVLEGAGFQILDGLLTFVRDLDNFSTDRETFSFPGESSKAPPADLEHGCNLRIAGIADSEAVVEIARHAFTYDRFHSDPFISPERADALHSEWLRNSITGEAADVVWLAEDHLGPLGFVTCKLKSDTLEMLGELIGVIVLVATSQRARRNGVGRALTQAALAWFRQNGVAFVEVGTQLSNIPAARLYESCGFRLSGTSLSLRKINHASSNLPALLSADHR